MTQSSLIDTVDGDFGDWSGLSYLDRARLIAPLIESEAEAIESAKAVTPKVVAALRDAGLFWVLIPKSLGGGGLSIVESMEVIEEIARADGSTGWAFMANSIGTGIAAGYLPESGSKLLFGGDDKAITAGMSAPVGRAVKADGGLRAQGKWQFGSGSDYATWIGCGLQVYDADGNALRGDDGQPDARFAFVPRARVQFNGNWNVSGLVGTGSVDYSIEEQFIPDELVMSTFSTTPVRTDGVYYLGLLGISVAGHTAVACGLMQRALQEVAKITDGKRRQGYPTAVGDYAVFQFEFAKYEAQYQGARAYAMDLYAKAEEFGAREGFLTPELTARVRQAATYTHHVTQQVVSFAHLWAGTQGFREPSFMGRATRDTSVLTQHLLIDNITMIDAAPALLDVWKAK
jgi:alkylation response protein AidB-like acyl-CoA dehydrogenase